MAGLIYLFWSLAYISYPEKFFLILYTVVLINFWIKIYFNYGITFVENKRNLDISVKYLAYFILK